MSPIIGRRNIPNAAPSIRTAKRSLYFDPSGIGARKLAIPVVSSLHDAAERATLECLGSFLHGRECIKGCKVGITRNDRRYFYMIYTKYRRSEVNYAITEEFGPWKGPLVVMRLDAVSATRLVSITSKVHRDLAIRAVAKFTSIMNARISTQPYRMVRWPQRLQVADN